MTQINKMINNKIIISNVYLKGDINYGLFRNDDVRRRI